MGLLGVALLLSFPMGHASTADPEVQGDLRFSKPPMLKGTLEGMGAGEVQVFTGSGLAIEGEGARIVVEEYRQESVVVDPPMLPPSELEEGLFQEYDPSTFQDARFSLLSVEEEFESLLMVEEERGSLEFSSGPVEPPLVAVKDAGLVLDTRGEQASDRGDDWFFTYVAEGDRYPFPAETAQATGAPVLYLSHAEFMVEGNGEQREFTSGAYLEEVAPGTYRHIQVYHLVRFEEGSMDMTGDHQVWMKDPVLELDGVLTGGKAEGSVDYKGERHDLEGVEFTAQGALLLRPIPDGDPAPAEQTGTIRPGFYSSYDEVYDSSRVSMSGDGSILVSYNGVPVRTDSTGVPPVAATVGIIGIIGAAVALTPQGKWALVGALAPLYAKTQRDRLLESPQRERLMEAIQANPGVHISRLRELTDLSWGTTVYHLRLMEKNELVTSVPRSGQRHFFVKTPGVDAARMRGAVSAIVGQETAHRVAFAVLNMPGASQKGLAEHLGVSSRVIAHHIARLVKADLVTKKRDGGFIRCYPTAQLGDALAILDTGEVASMAVTSGHQESQVPVVQA